MRKLLLAGALAATAQLSAQPTLTSMDAPSPGDVITLKGDSVYAYEGNSGANVTWNYGSVSTSMTATNNYVAASSTPYHTAFPGSNIASFEDTSTYNYWTKTSSIWQSDGSGSSMGNTISTDPSTAMVFPFTYNSSYTDSFASSGTIGGIQVDMWGTISVIADGYGTLITPAGTFNDVLRCKRILIGHVDVFGFTAIDTAEVYEWYKPGYKAPLMTITHQKVWETLTNTSDTGTYYSYLQPSPNNVEFQSATAALSIVPNPATDAISLPGLKTNMQYSIADITGRTIKTGNYHPGQPVSVATLPEGLYFLIGTDGHQKLQAKFQVRR